MALAEAAYLIVYSDKTDEWKAFAGNHLGAMAAQEGNAVYIRIDELKYRILVLPSDRGDRVSLGWATRNKYDFADSRRRVIDAGIDARDGSEAECIVRGVAAFIGFVDPAGNSHEICWGRTEVGTAFVSPAALQFVTGAMGFGHAVLTAGDKFDETIQFLEDVFGLVVSDFFRAAVPAGAGPGPRVNFLHPPNQRQHSLGIVEVKSSVGINHFMIEVATIDQVGRMLDRADQAGLVKRTLGRHVNDGVISFYMKTPSGFLVELGCGSKQMNWEGHDVRNITPGTLWGHKWL